MSRKQEAFEAIMEVANEIAGEDPRGLVQFVRLCGLTVLTRFLSWRLRSRDEKTPRCLSPDHLFFSMQVPIDPQDRNLRKICPEIPVRRTIALGKDLVLPWAWNRSRLAANLAHIGDGRQWGRWKIDRENHYAELWLPLGIAWGTNGNHSMTAGVIRGEGRMRANVVRDLSAVYQYVWCDGEGFHRKHDGMRIAPAHSPEFAAIFEVGRLMLKHGVSA